MVTTIKTKPEEFKRFHKALMKSAPEGYTPWYFPVEENDKGPDAIAIALRAPNGMTKEQGRYSWKEPHARLTYEEALHRLERGSNVGIAARANDPLVIIDIDHWQYKEQLPDTLTDTSRKRCGWHAYCYTNDPQCKTNIPTEEYGELRSSDQYVVAAGSYCTTTSEGIQKEHLPKEMEETILNDNNLGVYTVLKEIPPRQITYKELPRIFIERKAEDEHPKTEETEVPVKSSQKKGKYTDLFNLTINDVVRVKTGIRIAHPLHSSDTGKNFSVSKGLAHCWRHCVSLNPVQYLCVESGSYDCSDAGTPHNGGTSKIKGDKKALQIAYKQAVKQGLIKEYQREELKDEDDNEKNHEEFLKEIATQLANKTGFRTAARALIREQPIYYDKNQIWWLWNKKNNAWEIADETDIMTIAIVSLQLNGDQSVKNKGFMIEALRQEGRINKPKDFPKEWVQFKDRFFNIVTGDTYPATSEYFCVNPIPWSIGITEDTPTISKLFDQWVGPEYTQTLYEIIAYCCYTDYPIHIIVCLVGNGRNGKSKYQGLIQRFIGKLNISSTELEALFENRFETFKLYKKLVCLMGETNFNVMRNTSLLKRLTGQDLIGFEAKGKTPFDDTNYAKIIISTNGLPSTDDQSDGFFRRWMIIDFPNEFPEGKDILDMIPEEEYNNLAKKITKILPQLLHNGKFQKQGSIEERKKKYIETSNPLQVFIKEFCIKQDDVQVKYSTFYTKYVHWLSERKNRVVSRKEFSQMLEREGHEIQKNNLKNDEGIYENGHWIMGIKLKDNILDYVTDVTDVTEVSVGRDNIGANSTLGHIGHTNHIESINVVQDDFISKESMLETIRGMVSATKEDLHKLFPVETEVIEGWLMELLEHGDIMESKPGVYRSL